MEFRKYFFKSLKSSQLLKNKDFFIKVNCNMFAVYYLFLLTFNLGVFKYKSICLLKLLYNL